MHRILTFILSGIFLITHATIVYLIIDDSILKNVWLLTNSKLLTLSFLIHPNSFASFSYIAFKYVYIAQFIFLLIGLIIYIINKGTAILSCALSIFWFNAVINTLLIFSILIILYFSINTIPSRMRFLVSLEELRNIQLIALVAFIFNCILVTIGIFVLTGFSKNKIALIEEYDDGEKHLVYADMGKRMVHFFVDNLVFYFAGLPYIISKIYNYLSDEEIMSSRSLLLILIVIQTLFAYMLFELIFKRTPGKFLTNTILVNSNNSKPDLGKIMIRVLCRFIPFEQFGILTQKIWHDTFSDSHVVEVAESSAKPEKKIKSEILDFE